MSLTEWARKQGISYRTAWRMYRSKRLPASLAVEQLPTGTIRLHSLPDAPRQNLDASATVIYARINPRESAETLRVQIDICRTFCASRGWIVQKVVQEIAPSLGGKRPKLTKLLESPPGRIVVWKSTIISRFDDRMLSICLKHLHCELVVIDESGDREGGGGAMEDLVDAISVTCNRHYGYKRGNLLVEALQKVLKSKEYPGAHSR